MAAQLVKAGVVIAAALLLLLTAASSSAPTEASLQSERGAPPGTCGMQPTSDPDCARPDFGSCGNACCGVRIAFSAPSLQVAQALSRELYMHGSDAGFTPAKTWGPWFSLDAGGCRDMRSASETPDQFLCQASHQTSGPFHFVDTVNIKVGPTTSKGLTVVHFFSISNVAGALGDAGQNYKNIMLLARALEPQGIAASAKEAYIGCVAKGTTH